MRNYKFNFSIIELLKTLFALDVKYPMVKNSTQKALFYAICDKIYAIVKSCVIYNR